MLHKTTRWNLTAPAAGIIIAILILLFQAANPKAAIVDFATGSFTSAYYFGTVLNTAVLFITAGLGAALALKSGFLNLGGEGQIYAGGFTAAIVLDRMKQFPAVSGLAAALIAAAAAAALMAFVPALLKQFKNADVLLTSFLVSAATIPLIDALIAGKFRDVSGNLLATPLIAAKFQFTRLLEPSSLNTSVIPALILCAGMWYYLFRTASGRRLTIWGKAPEFAAYSGYSETRVVCFSLLGSGALHGLTGFFAVCGTYYSCQSGFYSGMGWNALSCALIAQSNPAALVPVGLIISWLYTGASRVSLTQNFGFDISSLIQGIVLFFISAHFISRKSKSGIGRQTEKKS